MPSLDDADSGLESLTTMESKDNSPKKSDLNEDDDMSGDGDDDLEETFTERLWGLTEMFPQVIRNSVWLMTTGSLSGLKSLYGFSRNAMWIFFSSSAILMAPVIFEVERASMEEMQKQQQRQILLGPNTAVSGGIPSLGMPMPTAPSSR